MRWRRLRQIFVPGRGRLAWALAVMIVGLMPGAAWSAMPPACSALGRLVEAQPKGPVFLASFPTATVVQLKGVAYLYDNALAAVALVGCGRPKLAGRIGAALLQALAGDRFWHDGRLRNAYLAGLQGAPPLKLPGWWDAAQQKWVEDGYQVGSDTGNQAFALLALLACYDAGLGPQYRHGAERLGHYLEGAFDRQAPAGFSGGTFGEEPSPSKNLWKSTEHNADLAAAFQRLAEAQPGRSWPLWAQRARGFVRAMWRTSCRCFAAGTQGTPNRINPLLAVDAQVFPLLAIPGLDARYGTDLAAVWPRFGHRGGIAYSSEGGGVWTEGTAQLALYMALSGQPGRFKSLMAAVAKNRAPDGSYYATDAAQLATGFRLQTDPSRPRVYFHLPHLGALAWVALAQSGFDPFTLQHHLPAPQAGAGGENP